MKPVNVFRLKLLVVLNLTFIAANSMFCTGTSLAEEAAQNYLMIVQDEWSMDPNCAAQAHIFNQNPSRPIRVTLKAESVRGGQKTSWRDTVIVQPGKSIYTGCINPTVQGAADTNYLLESSQF